MERNKKSGYYCCNPFRKHASWKRGNLFPVSKTLHSWYPLLKDDDLLCNPCRNRCYSERGTGKRVEPEPKPKLPSKYFVHVENNYSSEISVDANEWNDEQPIDVQMLCNVSDEQVKTEDSAITEDDPLSSIDTKEHILDEAKNENLDNTCHENVAAKNLELVEVKSEEPNSFAIEGGSKERLDSKREHVLRTVNFLMREFGQFPINSLDLSAPGEIEKKLDVLFNKLKIHLLKYLEVQ